MKSQVMLAAKSQTKGAEVQGQQVLQRKQK